MKTDPKKAGVPNICFSLIKEGDKREKKYTNQRLEFGFDDSETWSLCDTIAKFSIPRLERYLEIYDEVIVDYGLREKAGKLLEAFKLIVRDDGARLFTEEEEQRVKEGLEVFPEIFLGLWW